MSSAGVWVFFYGTIMNPSVLNEFGVTPIHVSPGKLNGFDLVIRPRPNLVRSDRTCVFGSLMMVSQRDLAAIYTSLEERFGLEYLPEAVLVESLDGVLRPALCYLAAHMPEAPPEPQFVKQLAECARTMQLPEWYALHIESLGHP
jgi:Gamma-glutamyl cyclotransferase, AIG2-like